MVLKFVLMHMSYHQPPSGDYPSLFWGLLVPPLLFLYLMVLHHQYFFFFFPHMKFLVMEWGLKVHTEMMEWPFPYEILYACIAFHFFHTFYRPFYIYFWTISCTAPHYKFASLSSIVNALNFTWNKVWCFLNSFFSLKTLS